MEHSSGQSILSINSNLTSILTPSDKSKSIVYAGKIPHVGVCTQLLAGSTTSIAPNIEDVIHQSAIGVKTSDNEHCYYIVNPQNITNIMRLRLMPFQRNKKVET